MAKLNRVQTDETTNYEDGKAFKLSDKTELYTRVASCLWYEATPFYGNQGDTEKAIIALANKVAPEWVVKLAVYAREDLYLRTIPQVLFVMVANRDNLQGKPKEYLREYGCRIMSRADEICEVVGFQLSQFGKPIPNALRKAVADRLNRLTEYEVMKYASRKGQVSLADVLNMIHPKPKDETQEALFGYIVGNGLNTELLPRIAAYEQLKGKTEFDAEVPALAKACDATWEFLVSKFGNKAEVWNIAKLPYMATLRNLNNLVGAGVDLEPYIELLTNHEAVRKSKQFPFRFWSAYKALTGYRTPGNTYGYNYRSPEDTVNIPDKIVDAVADAIKISAENMPRLSGKTFIATDSSGSMDSLLSDRGSITYAEVGFVLSAIADRVCDEVITGVFGSTYATVRLSNRDSVITNVEKLANTDVEHATNAWMAVRYLRENKISVDRIIIFSDMQCYDTGSRFWATGRSLSSEVKIYRKEVNKDVRVISINLHGYGTGQFSEKGKNVLTLAGWSDKIFNVIKTWEEDKEDAVKHIDNI